MPSLLRAVVCLTLAGFALPVDAVRAAEPVVRIASGPPIAKPQADAAGDKEPTPEQKFQKRYPQPVRVGFLIGLPVLDDGDSTIGYVRDVVRKPDGKIVLIVPYSAWFGWAHTERGKRPVAVPIETVAILARQLDALDMPRDDFEDAPTWNPAEGTRIPPEDTILIALGRR